MQFNLYDKLIKYITRGAFRQGNAAGGGYEAYEETLCNLTYGDRSWIACGKERVDLARACEILASAFGVERMAMVGGGHINTAFPSEVKHWHGAKADRWFSHIAVEVPGEDCRSEWCEPVRDEEYSKLV